MKKIIFILAAGLALSGCPGKGASNNGYLGYNPGGIFPNCPTCAGGTGALYQGSAYSSRVAMTVQIGGDANMIAQLTYSGMSASKLYSGQATMMAAINVVQPYYAGSCVIPAGQYQIQSIGVGSYQMGTFNFPQAQLSLGGYPVQVSLSGVIVNDMNGNPGGLGAQLTFVGCGDMYGVTLAPY